MDEIKHLLAKTAKGPLPTVSADGPVVVLAYPEEIFSARVSADVEALRKRWGIARAEQIHEKSGGIVVRIELKQAPKGEE